MKHISFKHSVSLHSNRAGSFVLKSVSRDLLGLQVSYLKSINRFIKPFFALLLFARDSQAVLLVHLDVLVFLKGFFKNVENQRVLVQTCSVWINDYFGLLESLVKVGYSLLLLHVSQRRRVLIADLVLKRKFFLGGLLFRYFLALVVTGREEGNPVSTALVSRVMRDGSADAFLG